MLLRTFLTENFLLSTPTARTLYHTVAAKQPIIDYHCHIAPREIYENRRFDDLTQLWLDNDHYKWRLLRANGVEEKYVTGTGMAGRSSDGLRRFFQRPSAILWSTGATWS